jgi:hypothetical protein
LRKLAPPLVAFAAQRIFLGVIAAIAGLNPFSAASYLRWDSVFYLDIAVNGYRPLTHCTAETHYPPDAWCGNAGWFPGYSWIVGLLAHAGLRPEAAAVLIAALAQLGCLIVIWRMSRDWRCLMVAAFFPGNVYLAGAFPTSLFLLAALLCLWGMQEGRDWPAAIAAAAAACCHPLGLLLAPIALLRRNWRVALGAVAGFAIVLGVMRAQTGDWDAYFKIQAHYGYRPSFGIDALLSRLKPLVNARYRDAKGLFGALQTLLVLAILVAVLRQKREPIIKSYFVAFWAAPLVLGGHLSLYRAEALLMPAALLLPSVPFAIACIAISVPMAALFFTNVLV